MKPGTLWTRLRRFGKVALGRELLHRRDIRCRPEWHGSNYGGWYVCPEHLGPAPVVYAFGIGEDVSFEQSLHKAYGGEIHSFDPTPRALGWVAQQRLPRDMTVHPWGILDIDGTARLHPPARKEHVSHSIVGGGEGIPVPVFRLDTIRKRLDHPTLDVMKMDVEGAEYRVVADLARSELSPPRQLLIEFHHGSHGFTLGNTRRATEDLRAMGYRLAAVSPLGRELTFVHCSALE